MRYSLISPYREYMPSEHLHADGFRSSDGEHISCVDVSDDLLHMMGLGNDCQLYALPMSQGGRSVVLTCIPYELWGSLCRITIHMADHPGSLERTAEVVADEGANMLTSWAAATTSAGEGCWTAIVSFADIDGEDIDATSAVETIESRIRERFAKLDRSSALPQFQLHNGRPLLESVTVERLRVLPALRKANGVNDARAFEGTITDYQIAFRSFRKDDGDLYTGFIEPYVRRNGLPAHFLVSPDPREGYFCLSPIRSYEFFQLVVEYAIFSRDSRFAGYFTTILKALTELGLNLYSAKNFLIKKGMERPESENSSEVPVERTRQEFIVDLERRTKPYDEITKLQKAIETRLHEALAEKANKNGDAVEGPQVRLQDVDRFEPCCFLSTNAHTEKQCEQVLELLRCLRSRRLKPVSVDIVMSSDRFIFNEAVQLLNASCIVVSMHFPVEENVLRLHARNHEGECCPSDWVLFEEAYGLARSRGVFRILQPDVRAPRYSSGQRTFVVERNDEHAFAHQLEQLLMTIDRYKQTDDFRRAFAESNRFAATVPRALLDRNVEQAYMHFIEELRKAGKQNQPNDNPPSKEEES